MSPFVRLGAFSFVLFFYFFFLFFFSSFFIFFPLSIFGGVEQTQKGGAFT